MRVCRLPGIRDTDEVVNVGQKELQELVDKDGVHVCKSKQGVVSEDSLASHHPPMDQALSTKTTERLHKEGRVVSTRMAPKVKNADTIYHVVL